MGGTNTNKKQASTKRDEVTVVFRRTLASNLPVVHLSWLRVRTCDFQSIYSSFSSSVGRRVRSRGVGDDMLTTRIFIHPPQLVSHPRSISSPRPGSVQQLPSGRNSPPKWAPSCCSPAPSPQPFSTALLATCTSLFF